jgi:hypothetical protein
MHENGHLYMLVTRCAIVASYRVELSVYIWVRGWMTRRSHFHGDFTLFYFFFESLEERINREKTDQSEAVTGVTGRYEKSSREIKKRNSLLPHRSHQSQHLIGWN